MKKIMIVLCIIAALIGSRFIIYSIPKKTVKVEENKTSKKKNTKVSKHKIIDKAEETTTVKHKL